MQALEAIDGLSLESVSGGAQPAAPATTTPPPRNNTTVRTNLGVTVRGVRVGAQVDVDTSRTNYTRCLDSADRRNFTAAETTAMCGLPPSGS